MDNGFFKNRYPFLLARQTKKISVFNQINPQINLTALPLDCNLSVLQATTPHQRDL
jgi:hypothetical protein